MNPITLEPAAWKLRRWMFLLLLVFLSQLLLIYLLSARKRASPRLPPARASLHLFTGKLTEAAFSETFLANDPTLFARANTHGFSGEAWLNVPHRDYDLSERTELPFWLSLSAAQLANDVMQFARTNTVSPAPLATISAPKILASPQLELSRQVTPASRFRVEGDLERRQLIDVPQLQSWAANEILANTIVQIAVDGRGTVLSPRLLSRSGSAEADRAALDIARLVQFLPSGKNETVFGKLIFDWHTIPLGVTNGVVKGPP